MPLPDVLGLRLTGIWTLATRGTDRRPNHETKWVNAKLVVEKNTHFQFLAVYEWDHQHVQEKGDGGDSERQ